MCPTVVKVVHPGLPYSATARMASLWRSIGTAGSSDPPPEQPLFGRVDNVKQMSGGGFAGTELAQRLGQTVACVAAGHCLVFRLVSARQRINHERGDALWMCLECKRAWSR